MSVNSTPRGISAESIPLINPNDYFNAEKVQSTIPCIVIKNLGQIVDEYFKLKPELINKENQIKGLYAYNQKMMETIQNFMQHEKKVVRKYNKLCQIYAKHFKQYWSAKNVEINFKDMMNPITSISETLSISQWKIEIKENPPLVITPKYEEMLLKFIKTYYLNQNNELQSLLERQLQKKYEQNGSEPESLSHIRQKLMQINTTPPTTSNMFDLLEKRKNIEQLIKEIDQNYLSQFTNKDLNFIDQVQRIHMIANNPSPQIFRNYLEHEAQIRRNLRKKSKKFRQTLELQFERIEGENAQLKQEIQQLRKKNAQLEESRNDFRNKFQYLQLKQKAGSKKQKSSSNISIVQQNVSIGMKQNTKKFEIRISQLEAQIASLKQVIADKQQINKHLIVKRQLMNSNSQMEQLRLKLCSKLMELGIVDTEAMTSGEMFDQIMEKQLSVKHYEVKDLSGNQNYQYIDINITQSVPFGESYKIFPNLQTPPQINQSIIEQQLQPDQSKKQEISFKRKGNVQQFQGKQPIRQTQQNYIRVTNIQSRDPPIYNPMEQSKPIIVNNQEVKQAKQISPCKKNYNSPISSEALLSISQRKSVQEQSKMHEFSKVLRQNKSSIDQKLFIKSQEYNRQIQSYLITIKRLQQKNHLLLAQQNVLRKQIYRLQQLLQERKGKEPSVFESIENQLKNTDKDQANQIQNICQSILKQLQKLDGDQFSKMMVNMEDVLKNFKSTSSMPDQNMNQIPVLSKNITQQQDSIKSENLLAHICLGKRQEDKKKLSIFGDRSGRLSLNSGAVKLQLKFQKSIYFGTKDQQPQSSEQFGYSPKIIQSKAKKTSNQREQSSIQFDQDQLIDIVNDFEGTSRKRKDVNNSDNSLKLSHSNLKNSRQSQIKSSLRIIDKIDRKFIQDTEFMQKMQQKLQQIKNNSQSGHDLYWFYKKYRQAIQALQSTQAKLKQFQRKKDICMNQLSQEDANLSKHKLQEKNYFLQQKVKELEDRLITNKEQYEYNMTEDIKGIEEIKQNAIGQMLKGIFAQKYNVAN